MCNERDRNQKQLNGSDSETLISIMRRSGGNDVAWLYDLSESLNDLLFDGRLPTPLITIEVLTYGHCLGLTKSEPDSDALWVPHVRMHRALFRSEGTKEYEKFRRAWGGTLHEGTSTLTFIHELCHIAQQFPEFIGLPYETSHNADSWIQIANERSEILDLPKACRRFKPARSPEGGFQRKAVKSEPSATVMLENLTMDAVSRWPEGIAQLVYPTSVEDWSNRVIDRLGLPRRLERKSD